MARARRCSAVRRGDVIGGNTSHCGLSLRLLDFREDEEAAK
jgi:hypothetical protein